MSATIGRKAQPTATIGRQAGATATIARVKEPKIYIVTTGLVAEYRFDEGSGQTLTDYKSSHNGQLGSTSGSDANDPAWSSEGLTFDGNDYVDIGNIAAFSGLTAWHVIAVARTEDTTGVESIFTKETEFRVQFRDSGIRALAWSGTTASTAYQTSGVSAGAWYFIDSWRDGADLGVRIGNDAALQTTATMGTSAPSAVTKKVMVGVYDPSAEPLSGRIAHILFYDRKLTDTEVTQNYEYLQRTVDDRGITI